MTSAVIGKPVPDFTASTTGNKTFKLSNLKDKSNLVLYFYPKDNTAGCTTEGLAFSEHYAAFRALNTEVIGVSRDSLKTHENFKLKQNFPFELLSDTNETICNLFDVIKLKTMYGKQVRGIERSTFLIDTQGVLRHEWRKISVNGHVDTVLTELQRLVT